MEKLVIHGIYRHYKGDYYTVEDVAHHSETDEELVIYRGLYGDSPLWVRPKSLFLAEIPSDKCKYGFTQKYRFTLQDIKSVADH